MFDLTSYLHSRFILGEEGIISRYLKKRKEKAKLNNINIDDLVLLNNPNEIRWYEKSVFKVCGLNKKTGYITIKLHYTRRVHISEVSEVYKQYNSHRYI